MTEKSALPTTLDWSEIDDKAVTLDANHALAGEDLTFEITLDAIG